MQKSVSPLTLAYKKYNAVLFAVVLFSFFINLLMFVGPLYMLQIYDRVLASRSGYTLVMITLISVGMLLAYGLLEFLRSRTLVRAGIQFDEVLTAPAFSRVIRMQVANPAANGRSTLSDIDKLRDFLTGQGIFAFFDAPWTPLFLGLCFAFNLWLGVVATTGAVIIFALALLNELMTRKALKEANTAGQRAAHFAGASLQNADVIKAMGMEEPLCNLWLKQRDQMIGNQARASDWAGVVLSASKFVRMVLQIAILGTGAFLAMKQEISPGIMIAASIVMGRALAPVEQAVGQWKQFIGARQAHARLKQMFDVIGEEEERLVLPDPKGNLEVEGLSSVLPGTRDTVLRGISFSITQGEILALIGASGSGKSTLARHLVGVGVPATGSVRLDGTELAHWDPTQLGKSIGYLAQDVKLFAGSVAENISRFDPSASDEDIIVAATLAGAHDMVQGLRNGYGTEVGDGGNQLSGGQKQRIGLARAVYKAPSLIVLDEPNSNLDSEGEAALTKCLMKMKEMGNTVVVVTHKANLLAVSDKTLILNAGMVQKFVATKELLQPQAQPDAAAPMSVAAAQN
ncbi:type I secretion system permease/ATPase [Candidatus Halocynthiibacter alkanivorans]|uniref:type I secretion system permease/ATPase n=1 Tax=Candidatus Halocynthiibacter alkanivorans TaxID=2267619 RepID=UPI000DF33DF3|nr:type I secretion system permease/ATPase [Candidatus Halocynthiibacter alkanivorans]